MLNNDEFKLAEIVFQNELLLLKNRQSVLNLVKTIYPEDSENKHIKVYLNTSNEKQATIIAQEFKKKYKIGSHSYPGVHKSVQINKKLNTFFLLFTEQDIRKVIKQTDYQFSVEQSQPPRKKAKYPTL